MFACACVSESKVSPYSFIIIVVVVVVVIIIIIIIIIIMLSDFAMSLTTCKLAACACCGYSVVMPRLR